MSGAFPLEVQRLIVELVVTLVGLAVLGALLLFVLNTGKRIRTQDEDHDPR
jgi:hypothetical protein